MGQRRPQRKAEQAEQPKKAPGRPFPKGVSPNPGGKPKPVPPTPPDPEGGVVTAERMRKVLAQDGSSDSGPTEKALRAWLDKDPKGFTGEIERRQRQERADAEKDDELVRLRAEVADLRKRGPAGAEDDPGTEAALELVEKLLREAGDVAPG